MKNEAKHRRAVVCFAVLALGSVGQAYAQTTFTVTSLDDDGPGTLRAQLAASTQTPAPLINFAVSGTIHLASTLNELGFRRNGLVVDGGNKITISGDGKVRVFSFRDLIVYTLQNLTIENGNADAGGAIRSNGFLTLRNVTFRNNTAGFGGAISAIDGELDIDSCTFTGNTAVVTGAANSGLGGAIATNIAARLFVRNSTFTNNHARRGGAFLGNGEEGDFSNSTIAGNSASEMGGGVFLGFDAISPGGSFSPKNSIIANNTGGNCASLESRPFFQDFGGNISYPDNTCPGVALDPKLGPLADNGGPTQTMALLNGSAAIDHVTDCTPARGGAPLATDQRGVTRPQGAACDSGAYEKTPFEFSGFQAPIANLPQVNSMNSGRAIPITFGVGGFQGMNIFAAGYPAYQTVSCATGQKTGPLTPIDTPGKSGLSYDSFTNTYSINWKTDKNWKDACIQLVVRLTDGIDHTALFQFR